MSRVPAPLRAVFKWWVGAAVQGHRRRRGLLALALFASVALFAALTQIDRVLRAMHPLGDSAFEMSALSDPGLPPPETGRPSEVAGTWWAGRTEGFTGPDTLAYWYLGLDLAFILAYSWALAILLLRLRRWLPRREDSAEVRRAAARRVARGEVAADSAEERKERKRILALADRTGHVLTVACGGVLVLAVTDVAENVLQGLAVFGCVQAEPVDWCSWPALTWGLYLMTALKWLLFGAIAVAAVVGLLVVASLRRQRARELWSVLVRVRTPLVLVLALALAYLVGATPFADQAADLLRRWNDEPHQALFGVVFTAVLCAVIWTSAHALIRATRPEREEPAGPLAWRIAAATALALGVVLLLAGPRGNGVLVLAGLLLALVVLGEIVGPVADDPPKPAAGTFGAYAVPAILAAAPLAVLGVALQGAALGQLAWAGSTEHVLPLAVGILLQAAGWGAYWWLRGHRSATSAGVLHAALAAGFAIALGVAVWTWVNPWGVAGAVGGPGILTAFAIALALAGFGLSQLAEKTPPPAALRIAGFRRTPFLVLVLLWGIGAAVADDDGGFHEARMLTGAGPPRGVTIQQLFENWREQRGLPEPPERGPKRPHPSSQATPLVLVAASGGGIRAAYWTAQTLGCLFGDPTDEADCPEPADPGPVIAASGVSGGSLGLAAWVAHLRDEEGTEDWVETLEADTLSPSLAWALFVDFPNGLLRTAEVKDRAEVLERSWEGEWVPGPSHDGGELDDESALARGLFADADSLPLLLLNGTAVESGCRFNVSVLDANVDQQRPNAPIEDCLSVRGFEPPASSAARIAAARTDWALGASVDVHEFLCGGRDLRLSTAALLSARFPYVSPSGKLTDCGDPPVSTYIVDGGYFDSSGAGTAAELWTALEPIVEDYNASTGQCVMPFAIQIDNGYDEPPGPDPAKRPEESIVPVKTVLSGRDAGEADARQALALAVSKPVGDVVRVMSEGVEQSRYAHLYPRAHPGTKAPLGWALSEATQDDLTRQLAANAAAMATIRDRWLGDGELGCERGSGWSGR
jgi:hypothetical protein